MEQLILLCLIINITGITTLILLAVRERKDADKLLSLITFIQDEEGHTKAVLSVDHKRKTNIFKNKQEQIDKKKGWS